MSWPVAISGPIKPTRRLLQLPADTKPAGLHSMAAAKAAAAKKWKLRVMTPADEQLGMLGNSNLAGARRKLEELLDEKPQHVWHLLEMLQNGTISKISDARARDQAKTHRHGTQVRMSVIPKYWMEAYMLDANPALEPHMERIKAAGKTALRELFYAIHVVSGGTPVPVPAHDKQVFAIMLKDRLAQCGNRLEDAHDWPDLPGFSWTSLPIFTTNVEGNKVTSITHISGTVYEIPEEQSVPAGGKWIDRWSDTEAIYKTSCLSLFMKDCFDFSSLDPKHCLPKLVPKVNDVHGHGSAGDDDDPAPGGKAGKTATKKSTKEPFNPSLLPVRNNRSKKIVKKVPGFGPSCNEKRAAVAPAS